VKVSVGLVPPAVAIDAFEQEKTGETKVQVNVSSGVARELPVSE
jgi:hypothetical protein